MIGSLRLPCFPSWMIAEGMLWDKSQVGIKFIPVKTHVNKASLPMLSVFCSKFFCEFVALKFTMLTQYRRLQLIFPIECNRVEMATIV